jgi:hypothetical protein
LDYPLKGKQCKIFILNSLSWLKYLSDLPPPRGKKMKKSKTEQTMNTSDKTIGEIVADDYRTTKVFENHGIDFCCGGNVALAATCAQKGIDLAAITGELERVKSEPVERSQL